MFLPTPSKKIAEKFFSFIFSLLTDSFKTFIQPAMNTAVNKKRQTVKTVEVVRDLAENIYGKRKLTTIKNKTKNNVIVEFSLTVSKDFLIKPENILIPLLNSTY